MDQATPLPLSEPDDRLYPVRPILAVSIAVLRGSRVLLATRTKPPYDGIFSLPGGVVEIGETLKEAALRELQEEVCVAADIIAFNRHVQSVRRDDDGRVRSHYIIASFVAHWRDGEGTPGPEAGIVRWLEPRDIATLPHTPHLLELVKNAFLIAERRACG